MLMAVTRRAAPVVALAVAVVIWATTFVASSRVLAATSPAVLTELRFALAAIVLVPLALRRSGLSRAFRNRTTAVLGLTGVAAYYGLRTSGCSTPRRAPPRCCRPSCRWRRRSWPPPSCASGRASAPPPHWLRPASEWRWWPPPVPDSTAAPPWRCPGCWPTPSTRCCCDGWAAERRTPGPRPGPTPTAVLLAAGTCLVGPHLPHPVVALGDRVRTGRTRPHTERGRRDDLPRSRRLRCHPSAVDLRGHPDPCQPVRDPDRRDPCLGYTFAVLTGEHATWGKSAGGVLAISSYSLPTSPLTHRTARPPLGSSPRRNASAYATAHRPRGPDGTEVVMHITPATERLRVEVVDGSRGGRVRPQTPDPSNPHGRGLHLVHLLADECGVIESEAGKTVWFELATGRRSNTAENERRRRARVSGCYLWAVIRRPRRRSGWLSIEGGSSPVRGAASALRLTLSAGGQVSAWPTPLSPSSMLTGP